MMMAQVNENMFKLSIKNELTYLQLLKYTARSIIGSLRAVAS